MTGRTLSRASARPRRWAFVKVFFGATLAAAFFDFSARCDAATYTWTGLAGSSSWNASNGVFTNWSPNSQPPSTADIQFTQVTPQANVNLQSARTINSLTFGAPQNYTLTNGSLTITSGNITVNSAASNQTLDVPVTLGAAGTITVASPATLTLTQAISDGLNSYGLTTGGTGTVSIQSTGNSVFTLDTSGGLLDVNGGAITVRDPDGNIYDTSFASSVTLRNGGQLSASGGNLQINGGSSNTLTIDGSSSSVSGANLFTLGNSGTPGNLHVSNGGTISNTNFLVVGGVGTGNLTCVATIDSGSQVTTGTGSIGSVTSALGSVTVTDPASIWHTTTMVIGGFSDSQNGGTGTLTVTNSGQVKVDTDTKFYTSTSSLIVNNGLYSTAQLETVSGVTPTIQLTDPTGKTALTLNNTNLGFTPNFAGTIVDGANGPGSVLKTGGATQILSGHNTYTGGTTIAGGTLQLGIGDALAATGAVTINSGATLDLGGHEQHIGNLALTSGSITGATGSTLVGHSLTLSSGTVSVPIFSSTGITKNTAGTVTVTALIATGASSVLTVSQGTLDAQAGIQSSVNITAGQLKARGTLAGNLTSSSNTTLTLTGGTNVNAGASLNGTLDVNSQTVFFAPGPTLAVSTTAISGGVISAPGGYPIANSLSGYGTVAGPVSTSGSGTRTITASGGTLALGTYAASDSLSGYAGNLAAGSQQLILASSGFTSLGNSATIAGGSINSINGVRVNSGKTLSGFGTVGGPLNNQGTITGGSGSDVLNLTGAVTGPGSFQQSVSFEGSYSPGNSPASVSLSGTTTFTSTNQLLIELGGTILGTQYDHIAATGSVNLGGALNISLIGGFTPNLGNTFDILDWGTRSGTFNSVNLPTLSSGLTWSLAQLYTSGSLSVVDANLLPGDFNRDGQVTSADIPSMLAALTDLNSYAATKSLTAMQLVAIGDLDGSGTVTDGDIQSLLNLVANLGSGSVQTVPEPSALASLTAAAIAALFFSRRL